MDNSTKHFSCGCIRFVVASQLGAWKKACPDHILAAMTAFKRKTFPKPPAKAGVL